MDKKLLDLSADEGTIALILNLYRLKRRMESPADATRLDEILGGYCFYQGDRNKDGVHRLFGVIARLRRQLERLDVDPDV